MEINVRKSNFSKVHQLITFHLLPKSQQYVHHKTEILVMEHKTGRIQYEAASLSKVEDLYNQLWIEIDVLLTKELTIDKVFYSKKFKRNFFLIQNKCFNFE
jgi:hypothetical protein